jgi:hypothetical protein
MENQKKNPEREKFIFTINDKQIDVLPFLRLVDNEGADIIAAAIDTLLFQLICAKQESQPDYMPSVFYIMKEVRDSFLRVDNGTELYFHVVGESPKKIESKLYWTILKA